MGHTKTSSQPDLAPGLQLANPYPMCMESSLLSPEGKQIALLDPPLNYPVVFASKMNN